ncbi:MAG: LysM peptidoglycan-binding domain-containing protein [Rhodobacteraceae bacterium]|nr:MAG: LysM peptidoglycan-binding domain-containing protein [Paracoccaceae bacterium]
MTKWSGVLGGGAVGAAVVVAGYVGLTASGVLPRDPQTPPDPADRTEAPVARETPEAEAVGPVEAGGETVPDAEVGVEDAPEQEAPAEEVREPDVVVEDISEPETVVEAPPEPAVPSEDAVEVAPGPPVNEAAEATPVPEPPVEDTTETAPEPEPPVDATAETTPAAEPAVQETAETLPEPEAPVKEAHEVPADPETPAEAPVDAPPAPETAVAEPSPEPPAPERADPAATPPQPPETAAVAADAEEPQPERETGSTAVAPAPPDTGTAQAEAAPPAPPTFDLIRVEQDGAALVAGKGAPRAEVTVFLDGTAIAETRAGADGKFASLMDLAPSPQPRLMTLAMTVEGARIFAETEVIVAPFGPKPAPLAETEPAAPPEDTAIADAGAIPDPEETAAPPEAETPPPEAQDQASGETDAGQDKASDIAQAETPAADPVASESAATDVTAAPADTGDETPAPVVTTTIVPPAQAPSEDPAPALATPSGIAERTAPPDPLPEAETAPRLLASDEEGVRVLPGPVVLDRVAIDTISYDDAGDVALAGRGAGAQGGGFVRVYLDNSPITTSRIRPDGSWRVTLPEVDKGVYVLRVDEVDEDGAVKSRAETPFQREDRETLERAAEGTGGGPAKILTVQPGNTLWQIARDRYGEGILYVRVFEANRNQIRDPDLIYPGQVFDLPEDQPPAE